MKHMGFKRAMVSVEKGGYKASSAAAIVASASRGASASAKKHNPRLKRVKG